ncbi:MAG: group II intron reverse transcriptase/maturase [Candidatus Omnitrophota bacterium]|nr:group II intron reverse transcriptase/maturase [Candidatus Omnitrophota bacterium]
MKGGVWFSLIDKVYDKRNLHAAFRKVSANRGSPGVDHVTIGRFADKLDENIEKLYRSLKEGSYCPQKIWRVQIPKGGKKGMRPLGIPTVRDRVVQAAVQHVIEPIFDKDFSGYSYGFRPKRGCKDALRRVDELLKAGYRYVVDADIESYFDSIPHERLMVLVEQKVADGRMLKLIESYLKQGVMEGMNEWTLEEGTPQGGVISPLLANIYLDSMDWLMEDRGYSMVRYADDSVVLCRTEEEAIEALEQVRQWMKEAGLKLHPGKTRIVEMKERGANFDFLGYNFGIGRRNGKIGRRPRRKSLQKFMDTIRSRTGRCNGHSMKQIVRIINPTLRGWYEYYKHSNKWTFIDLDKWIRMRLRSIMRKRRGGRGRGRGLDHNHWRNKFFADLGLFSLTAAWESAVSPR